MSDLADLFIPVMMGEKPGVLRHRHIEAEIDNLPVQSERFLYPLSHYLS